MTYDDDCNICINRFRCFTDRDIVCLEILAPPKKPHRLHFKSYGQSECSPNTERDVVNLVEFFYKNMTNKAYRLMTRKLLNTMRSCFVCGMTCETHLKICEKCRGEWDNGCIF